VLSRINGMYGGPDDDDDDDDDGEPVAGRGVKKIGQSNKFGQNFTSALAKWKASSSNPDRLDCLRTLFNRRKSLFLLRHMVRAFPQARVMPVLADFFMTVRCSSLTDLPLVSLIYACLFYFLGHAHFVQKPSLPPCALLRTGEKATSSRLVARSDGAADPGCSSQRHAAPR
jgi:hypothetical protein